VHGYTTGFAWAAAIFAAGALVAAALYEPGLQQTESGREPVLA
jgi:hypothetical protein